MTHRIRTRLAAGLVSLALAATLAACGGGTPSANVDNGHPGAGDAAICKAVTSATKAFDAKQYDAWRLAMAQIGNMAGSAHYVPIKKYAEELHAAYDTPTTTTTTPPTTRAHTKGKHHHRVATVNAPGLNQLFGGLGGYTGLQKTCKKVHLS